jgi:hypothetical protein
MAGKNEVAVCGEHGHDIETVETKTTSKPNDPPESR